MSGASRPPSGFRGPPLPRRAFRFWCSIAGERLQRGEQFLVRVILLQAALVRGLRLLADKRMRRSPVFGVVRAIAPMTLDLAVNMPAALFRHREPCHLLGWITQEEARAWQSLHLQARLASRAQSFGGSTGWAVASRSLARQCFKSRSAAGAHRELWEATCRWPSRLGSTRREGCNAACPPAHVSRIVPCALSTKSRRRYAAHAHNASTWILAAHTRWMTASGPSARSPAPADRQDPRIPCGVHRSRPAARCRSARSARRSR